MFRADVRRRRKGAQLFFLSSFCCDLKQEWEWEHAGFGKPRAPLGLPMRVGATFESIMDALEEEQARLLREDDEKTAARRKLMEHVAVQIAQYQILLGRNARALQASAFLFCAEGPLFSLVAGRRRRNSSTTSCRGCSACVQ